MSIRRSYMSLSPALPRHISHLKSGEASEELAKWPTPCSGNFLAPRASHVSEARGAPDSARRCSLRAHQATGLVGAPSGAHLVLHPSTELRRPIQRRPWASLEHSVRGPLTARLRLATQGLATWSVLARRFATHALPSGRHQKWG